MDQRDNFERLMGVEVEETPETMGFRLSAEFSTQVMAEVKRRGMMLKDLADSMGVSPGTLSGMLGAKSNMTMKTVARLAMALGCEVAAPVLTLEVEAPRGGVVEYRSVNRGQAAQPIRLGGAVATICHLNAAPAERPRAAEASESFTSTVEPNSVSIAL